MRPTLETIKQAVLHDDQDVRDAAMRYFAQPATSDCDAFPLVLRAVERYGSEAFSTYFFLADLPATPESVGWLISEIERVESLEDVSQFLYYQSLTYALLRAGAEALQPLAATIREFAYLSTRTKAIVAGSLALHDTPPEALWNELRDFCQVLDEKERIDRDDNNIGWSFVRALARYPEQFSGRVLEILSDELQAGTYLEWQAVRLAGRWRLEAAVPQIAELLTDLDTLIFSDAQQAMVGIGGDTVLAEIMRRFPTADEGFRMAAASVLGELRTEVGVQTALELLAQEQDENVRSLLLQTVLDNFATEGIEPARQFLLSAPKNLAATEVRSALLVASKMTGQFFPEFENWQLEAIRDAILRKRYAQEALRRLDSDVLVDEEYAEDDDEEEDFDFSVPKPTFVRETARVGRNDPCPCGSGKKFKKCCYGKESLT